MDAVSQGNSLKVKIMMKDSLLVDTSFNQFNEMLSYAEYKINGLWISDDEDEEYFSESPYELNPILAGLVNNFSKRRVNHLKKMIKSMYPYKNQNEQSKRECTVIKNTHNVIDEYRGIIEDRKALSEICSQISIKKQIDTKDIEDIKNAAMSIVSHCNKITGK
jgi:hypothetical protein